MSTVIKVENLSKYYRLGLIGGKTLHDDLNRWWARVRKQPDPLLKIGQEDRQNGNDESIWALQDVSFEVKQGEIVGIIGRNGAGKSTLLKILSRITAPTSGQIKVKGRVASLLEVGTGFHPELTGRENIYLNGTILGMKRNEIDRKFNEIVAFAEIEKFIDTPVKRYSSGMYVRLAFAVAAHLEPEILVVDEVLAVGDTAFQKKCLGKMGEVAREGRTVLFVSHNMAAIRKLCPRAILLKNGCLQMKGQTESVIAQYLASSASEMSPVVALPSGPSDAPGAGICLRFIDCEEKSKAQFRLGEPWRIMLEFEIFRSVPHVIAAVGLMNVESVPIITYWSRPKDLGKGRYVVEFKCTLPLNASDVQFAVGLSSRERAFYYTHAVGHIAISDIALNQQPFRASGGILFSIQESKIHAFESTAEIF